MLIAGVAASVLGMAICAAAVVYLWYRELHSSIVILFLFVLILGDSRVDIFQFIKDLRVEVMMLIFLITIFEVRNQRYKINAIMLYLLPFLAVALLALIFSPTIGVAFSKTISFAIFYFVLFNYVHHKLQVYGIQLMADVLYLIVTLLILGFIFLPLFPEFISYGGTRYNGIMGNPNGMGMLVTLATPITAYLFQKHSFPKRFKTFVWILITVSLLMCSSRNAIFSISLFWMLYLGLRGTPARRIFFMFVFLPGVAIILYKVDLETVFTTLGLDAYFRVKELDSGSGRIFAWAHAYELIKKAPLIGCGFSCEEYNFTNETSFQLWKSGHQGGVHNSYLAFAVNTGFVGTVFFLGFLLNAARMVRNWRFLIPFMFSILFSAIFESWLFSSLSAFHVLFLIFLVFLIVDTNKEELLVSNLAGDFSHEAAKGVIR
ncbi:MAG: O-antigen ligase family protein [Bacteroidia bacterium]|nr:O-antigen ligase family protein [Bacteroidia bacterium]